MNPSKPVADPREIFRVMRLITVLFDEHKVDFSVGLSALLNVYGVMATRVANPDDAFVQLETFARMKRAELPPEERGRPLRPEYPGPPTHGWQLVPLRQPPEGNQG